MIDKPMVFEEAIRFLLDKDPNPQEWDAADWGIEKPAVRVRSFFSSRVESARFLDRAQGLIFDYMAKVRDDLPNGQTALRVGGREDFVMLMRRFMIEEGMAKSDEFQGVNQGDLTDIRSMSRLRLIFDTNVRQAYGYGQWRQGMKPAVRRAFPAARFVRQRGVLEPRPRHAAHINEARLKTDFDWWSRYQNDPLIGGFGVPWGPYGFYSGMGQEDVSRAEAARLGLKVDTGTEEMTEKPLPGLNENIAASVRKMDPETKRKLLEELRGGPKPRDPEEAGREAAAAARRAALERGIENAESRGNTSDAERIRELLQREPRTQSLAVQDEGDEIRLREDIGERISKVKKREGMATPEQERAIAEAVFERIERKVAEPRNGGEQSRGAPRARQLFGTDLVLTPEERLLLESPHEILLIHTPEGRLRKAVSGTQKSVNVPDGLPSGSVLSHNHPGGTGASASDLSYVLSNPGITLRIVTKGSKGIEIYQIRASRDVSPEELEVIVAQYEEIATGGGDTREARLEALALILARHGEMLSADLAIVR